MFRKQFLIIPILIVLQIFSRASFARNQCIALFAKSADKSDSSAISQVYKQVDDFYRAFAGSKAREMGKQSPSYPLANMPLNKLILQDPSQGQKKFSTLKTLGFDWTKDSYGDVVGVAPTWINFNKRYMSELKRRGIPESEIIRPAIVFVKDHVGGDGMINLKFREFRLVDPTREQLPSEDDGFRVLKATLGEFNLPVNVIISALKEGKWPLLDAFHDVGHFVAFLNYPGYAKTILSRFQKITPAEETIGFKRRKFWLLEYLSLPDPEFRNEIFGFLNSKQITRGDNLASIRKKTSQMRESEMQVYAIETAQLVTSVLADISGGTSSTTEKLYFQYIHFIPNGSSGNINHLPFDALESSLNFYLNNISTGKRMALETQLLDPGMMAFILQSAAKATVTESQRARRLSAIQELTARLNYTLLRSMTDLGIEQWVEGMLQGELSASSPLGAFLLEIFPNDDLLKYYLGRGVKWPKQQVEDLQ